MDSLHRRGFLAASAASVVAGDFASARAFDMMDWGTLSRAARDAAYDNSAAVRDSAQILAGWVKASNALRAERQRFQPLSCGGRAS